MVDTLCNLPEVESWNFNGGRKTISGSFIWGSCEQLLNEEKCRRERERGGPSKVTEAITLVGEVTRNLLFKNMNV